MVVCILYAFFTVTQIINYLSNIRGVHNYLLIIFPKKIFFTIVNL